MVTKNGLASGWSVDDWPEWSVVCELLKTGQYEQLAELLRQSSVANGRADESLMADILAAAYRICLACGQCHNDVAWHRRAYDEADRRERELRRQLYAILDSVNGHDLADKQEQPIEPPHAPITELDLSQSDTPKSVNRLSLWQRVLNLLGRRPSRRSYEPEAYAASNEVLVASSAERFATPAAAYRDRVVVHVLPSTEQVDGHASRLRREAVPPVPDGMQEEQSLPSLTVYCFGFFRVFQEDQPVEAWLSSKGQSVFKYLVTHRERPVAKEVLMELFWPGAHPDAARNNLNVAIYGLRQTLRKTHPDFSHVLFLDDRYLLNPELQIWIDVEEFIERFRTAQNLERQGEQVLAAREYRAAEALYQGEFLEEDRYEEWVLPHRQKLQDNYLNLLDRLSRQYFDEKEYDACTAMCSKMLAVDPCREEAHRRLMRCYSWQGQPYLALRQYHLCVEALKENLDVFPTQKTATLYKQIWKGMRVPT